MSGLFYYPVLTFADGVHRYNRARITCFVKDQGSGVNVNPNLQAPLLTPKHALALSSMMQFRATTGIQPWRRATDHISIRPCRAVSFSRMLCQMWRAFHLEKCVHRGQALEEMVSRTSLT
jgi:hypothetical protein